MPCKHLLEIGHLKNSHHCQSLWTGSVRGKTFTNQPGMNAKGPLQLLCAFLFFVCFCFSALIYIHMCVFVCIYVCFKVNFLKILTSASSWILRCCVDLPVISCTQVPMGPKFPLSSLMPYSTFYCFQQPPT